MFRPVCALRNTDVRLVPTQPIQARSGDGTCKEIGYSPYGLTQLNDSAIAMPRVLKRHRTSRTHEIISEFRSLLLLSSRSTGPKVGRIITAQRPLSAFPRGGGGERKRTRFTAKPSGHFPVYQSVRSPNLCRVYREIESSRLFSKRRLFVTIFKGLRAFTFFQIYISSVTLIRYQQTANRAPDRRPRDKTRIRPFSRTRKTRFAWTAASHPCRDRVYKIIRTQVCRMEFIPFVYLF